MLETLSRGFKNAKARLTGVTELTPDNIEEALRDVRLSLLEADVEFGVVKALPRPREGEGARRDGASCAPRPATARCRRRPSSTSSRSATTSSIELMGPVDTDLELGQEGPDRIMMVGLQGSGKTTTVGKLARWLEKQQEAAAARRRRHLAPGRRRAAQGARRAARHAGLHHPGRARRSRSARRRSKRATRPTATSSSTTPPAASRSTSRSWRSSTRSRSASNPNEHLPRRRRDDRPGRGQDAPRRSTTASASPASSSPSSTATRAAARRSSIKEVTGAPIKFLGMGEGARQARGVPPRGHGAAASSAWATSSA